MRADDEVRHLKEGPSSGERPGGIGIQQVLVRCPGNAPLVLARCREVLAAVFERQGARDWLPPETWKAVVPEWFVKQCAREPTKEEEEERLKKWESMTVEEKWQEGEGTWSLEAFLHWFRPSERYWYWWDAAVEDPDTLRVSLEIEDWPVPWAALRWLFRAAGALHAESA